MTETVAPWDVGRPAPQPSQAVASVAAPQQSDAGPRALAAQGQAFTDVAAEVDRFGLHIETLQAQDAINQLRSKKDDLTYGPQGFMTVKGGDVVNPNRPGGPLLDDFKSRFQAVSDDLSKNLGPRARQMYNERAAIEATGLKSDIAKHSIQQTELYGKSVFASGNAQDTSDAVRYSTDPAKVGEFAARARERATKYAQSEGLDPGAFAASAESNVVRAAIESRASQNDAAGALSLFKTYGSKLDAKDTIEVGRTMRTVGTEQAARSYVADLNVDEGARRDDTIKSLIAEGYSPALAAGFAANFFHESRFRTGAVNKGDGRDGSDSINIGQWNGARAIALRAFAASKGLDINDPKTGMLYAKAELEGEIPQSVSGITPEIRARIKAAKTPAEAAAALSEGFFRPAGGAGEATARGQTAEKFSTDFMAKNDPLAGAVNAQSPSPDAPKPAGPPGFRDTRQMLIDAEKWHIEASTRNQKDNAANPDMLSSVQNKINVQFEGQKQQIQLDQHKLNKAVEDWVTRPAANGRPQVDRPPPEIWNQLTYEKQRSIDATLKHNATGADGVTDWQRYYEIQRGLTSVDPEERGKWANFDLWQDKPRLAHEQFTKLADLQGTVRKGDPDKEASRVASNQKMIDERLTSIGVGIGNKASPEDHVKEIRFNEAVQDRITQLEKSKPGHKATSEEVSKILRDLTYEVTGSGGWFSRNIGVGSRRRVYEVPNPDASKLVVPITSIPKSDLDKITAALKAEGVPITDEEVVKRYKAVRLVKP